MSDDTTRPPTRTSWRLDDAAAHFTAKADPSAPADAHTPDSIEALLERITAVRAISGRGTKKHRDAQLNEVLSAAEEQLRRVLADLNASIDSDLPAEQRHHRADELQQLGDQLSALQTANERLEEFVSVASHDLRSPLRAVHHLTGFIVSELGDSVDPAVEVYLSRLGKQVVRMSRMLDDLFDYARSQDRALATETVDTAQTAREAGYNIGLSANHQLMIAGDMPALITDRAALALVFRNLIGNAASHHDHHAGRIEISCKCATDDLWTFVVSDDGPGMAMEERERLNAFLAGPPETPQPLSTGLGLVLVKRAVQANGGTVRLEPGDSRGCRAIFTWRAAAA